MILVPVQWCQMEIKWHSWSIYGSVGSQPKSEDVTYVTFSLIGCGLAQLYIENRPWSHHYSDVIMSMTNQWSTVAWDFVRFDFKMSFSWTSSIAQPPYFLSCVGNLIIIGPDNGLSPGRRQAIIWTNAGILIIGPRGTNFSEIFIGIQAFPFKKMNLKTTSAKWRPFFSASMC